MPGLPRRAPRHDSRRLTTVAAVLASALLASGCGAGTNATTTRINSSGVGVTEYADRIRVLNALVFPAAPPVRPETVLSVGIANDWSEADQLTGIELARPDGAAGVAWVEIVGPRVIPAGGMLLIGAVNSPTVAYLCGEAMGTDPTVSLTFRFAHAEPITVTTVMAPLGSYWETDDLAVHPVPPRPGSTPCAGPPAAGPAPEVEPSSNDEMPDDFPAAAPMAVRPAGRQQLAGQRAVSGAGRASTLHSPYS